MPTAFLVSLLAAMPSPAAPDAGLSPPHFVESDGGVLGGFDEAWTELSAFYGKATPATFTVEVRDAEGPSQFNTSRSLLLTSRATLAERGGPILAHEGSHVCLSRLTDGASEVEALRFIDEGLALIFEHQLAGTASELARSAPEAAALQRARGNLSLAKLARWSTYFGDPHHGQRTSYAYPVGAAFDLFVRKTYGEARFFALLEALGRTRALDAAARTALGLTAPELEAAWLASLGAVASSVPKPISFDPRNGATAVSEDTRALHVRFDHDMTSAVCVRAECGSSHVCYTGARWTSPRELTITPDGPLLRGHAYRIDLGIAGRCQLSSLDGQRVEPIVWEFQTR